MTVSAAQAATITWNDVCDETYGAAVGAKVFDEKLQELSGGTMQIDLYLDGLLGSEQESMQGIQLGTLDVFRGNASSLSDYGAEVLGATGLPYLFKDMEEFEEMAASPLGQEILDSVPEECGFVALAWLVEGPRNLFITAEAWEKLGKPDHISLDMMQDLSIRVPGTELLTQTMKALGAQPLEISYSELVNSLHSGNIDGAENGIGQYLSQEFYQAAPYFIPDAHIFGCGVVLMNADTWNSFNEEQQGWLKEAGKAASDACYEYNMQQEQLCLDQFEELGVTLLPVTDIEEWQAACEEVYSSQSEEAQAVIQRIRDHDY